MVTTLDAVLATSLTLEGYKNYRSQLASGTMLILEREVQRILSKYSSERLSDLSAAQFKLLLAEIRAAITLRMSEAIEAEEDETEEDGQEFFLLYLAAFGHITGRSLKAQRSTSRYMGESIGVGVSARDLLRRMVGGAVLRVTDALRGAMANRLPFTEVSTVVIPRSFRQILSGWRSVLNTVIQFMNTRALFTAVRLVAPRYQWVSVLDDRTTEICTERDGNVYVVGQGPLPPAHYNCRSTIAPVFTDTGVGSPNYPSVGTWLSEQENARELVTPSVLRDLQKGISFGSLRERIEPVSRKQLTDKVRKFLEME